MPVDELRRQLESLHEALAQADQINPATRSALQKVAEDIERLLHAQPPQESEDAESPRPAEELSNDVQSLLLQFESQHPRLTEMLTRISDALANLGI